MLGVLVAVWLTDRRWRARGGEPGHVGDIAVWAVPFGLVGGRLYHVITDWQLYFGTGMEPLKAPSIWEGGLGIWGAVALGAVGAWLGCRRRGIVAAAPSPTPSRPGIAFAQAIGRWGNWFNQELYGGPTTLPWALEIDPAHRPPGRVPRLPTTRRSCTSRCGTWAWPCSSIWAGRGSSSATAGCSRCTSPPTPRAGCWIEWLRVDPAHHILGLRLNKWTALLVLAAALVYLTATRRADGPPR